MENKILTKDLRQGRKLQIAGGEYRIIISGEETNGTFAIIEMSVPSGAGPVPHAHPNFQETFYVLEGELNFHSEMGSYLAKKGATVSIPKGGLIHHFKNNTDQAARLLCTVVPAGLDDFFIEASEFMESVKMNPQNSINIKEAIAHISMKYGQTLLPPDYLEQLSSIKE